MLEIADRRIGQPLLFQPLPPHPTAQEIVLQELPLLRPPSRISVTRASRRDVRVPQQGNWQAYDPEVTPYMVEPQDMTASRRFKVACFVGPSQTGKTQMLQNTVSHRVLCDQMPCLIVHMDRPSRDKWVEAKLDPMILNSPALRDAAGKSRDDSTFSRKRFRGMVLEIGYPTPAMLSSATYGLVALTDFDHMKQVLGPKDSPEGSPLGLSRQRIRTYRSRGMVLVESTCAFPWKDPSWKPSVDAPHMLPPTTGGIVLIYNEGTRARLYWECPDCEGLFEPRIDRLVYDDSLLPGDAGESAEMACPNCGSLIGHRHKNELNRAILKDRGGWRHETTKGDLCSVHDEAIRKTDIVSYSLNGAAATFSSWQEIVANFEVARRKAQELDDETDLAQVYYTEIGWPFKPRQFDEGEEIGLQFLKDNAPQLSKGIAPSWTRFITVSADVQKGRFVVQFTAWGEEGRAQVIDRLDLITPPDDAPGIVYGEDTRALDPAKYAEDWQVLVPLLHRVFPVDGEEFGLRPLAASVDFQGEPGVSDNAEAFWKDRRANGEGRFWFVTRGYGGMKQRRRTWHEKPEGAAQGKKARSIKILNFASDRIKDTVWASYGKSAHGAKGAFYLGDWMKDAQIEEAIAEARDEKKGWEKRPGKVRNETFDLCVMARVLAEHHKIIQIDWSNPPKTMLGGPANSNAVPLNSDGVATRNVASNQPARRMPKRLF